MSRAFNGTSDYIEDTGASITLTGAVSMLAVLRIMDTNDTSWLSFIEAYQTSGPTLSAAMGRLNDGNIYFYNSSGNDSATAISDGDNWMIVAIAKATGTADINHHKLPIGGSRTTTNAGARPSPLLAGNIIRLGGNSDFANIRLAAAAIFTTELTTGQLDGILSAKTTASINALSPVWIADDSDGFATELLSTRALTLNGTSDNADDPSGWVYGLGGAPGASQRFMWMP